MVLKTLLKMRYDSLLLSEHQPSSVISVTLAAMKRYLPLVVLSVLAVTLYCLYAEVPTLVQNIEVDGGNKSSDMRTKTEVWDTMDGRGYQFREKVGPLFS